MIGIIDYGLGNVRAFENVYKKLNIPAMIVGKADELRNARKLILPGVGAFDHAMERLEQSGMRQPLDIIVRNNRAPILGVCVGMHMLALSSEEGRRPGLGWIDGEVRRFAGSTSENKPVCIPHMGWNDVRPIGENGLFRGLENDARFYFLHSYYFSCRHPESVVGVTTYGGEFACAVHLKNVYGVQFHPEKSHQWGMQLLKNFAET